MENTIKKTDYINVLNVIAMFAVVMLHTNSCFWNYSTDKYWFEANLIESVMYYGVPIFFMISGATLLDYKERYSTKEFFVKRIKKTVIPFVFWSIFGVYFNILIKTIDISQVTLEYILHGIYRTNIVAVYWFFTPLFCMYLALPLFASVSKQDKMRVFSYLTIVGIIINSGFPFLSYFFKWFPYNGSVELNVTSSYIIFVLLGYLLNNIDFKPIIRILIYLIGIVGLGIHAIGVYVLSTRDGNINRDFKGYTSVQSIMYAVGIFVFIKNITPYIYKSKLICKLINFVKKYTFGIYLLHWFVLKSINQMFDLDTFSLKYRLIMPFIIISICIVIITVLRKMPLIKHVVP